MTARKQTKPAAKRTEPTRSVAQAVEAAAASADWLTAADQGALRLALKLAGDIDRLGSDDATQLAALARTFLTTLDRLGLTVTSRRDTAATVTEEADPLAQLRLRAEARLTDTPSRDAATVRALPRR